MQRMLKNSVSAVTAATDAGSVEAVRVGTESRGTFFSSL
jgi:hypothetical protein